MFRYTAILMEDDPKNDDKLGFAEGEALDAAYCNITGVDTDDGPGNHWIEFSSACPNKLFRPFAQ